MFAQEGGIHDSYLNPQSYSKKSKKGDKRKISTSTAGERKSKKSETGSVKSAGSSHSRGSISSCKVEEADSELAQLKSELKG